MPQVSITVIGPPSSSTSTSPPLSVSPVASEGSSSPSTVPPDQEHPSLVGTYAEGYEDGKNAAYSTHSAGGSRYATCPSGHTWTYCTGYHVGYDY
jgi:hypothetical protein